MAAEMKFMIRTAGYAHLDYKKNLDIMKELNTQPVMDFIENCISLTGKTMYFVCLAQESHSKFSVTNQKDKGLWEYPSNISTRL